MWGEDGVRNLFNKSSTMNKVCTKLMSLFDLDICSKHKVNISIHVEVK
jgi:hypothetical protein